MGLFRVVAATGKGFRATLANEADDAGAIDRWREIVRKPTRRANETRRDRCHGCRAERHRPLDSGGKTEGNNRRTGYVSLIAQIKQRLSPTIPEEGCRSC